MYIYIYLEEEKLEGFGKLSTGTEYPINFD